MVSEKIYDYITSLTTPEDEVLRDLARETHLKVQMPQMISGHIQGEFLTLLTRMIQPKRILEIGTFTGYSAICMARGLAGDGKLISLDVNEELEPMVSKYILRAGLGEKIDLCYGHALEVIPTLHEVFDLVFIDADKINYVAYLEAVLPKVRVDGWIWADNVLWKGRVAEEPMDKDTLALHRYNQAVAAHPQLRQVIVPLRDGLSLAQKIS